MLRSKVEPFAKELIQRSISIVMYILGLKIDASVMINPNPLLLSSLVIQESLKHLEHVDLPIKSL